MGLYDEPEDEDDELYNPANWPDPDASPREWVLVSLKLLRREIKCCMDHYDRMLLALEDEQEEAGAIYLHLTNSAQGIEATMDVLRQKLLAAETIQRITLEMIQQETGQPMEIRQITLFGRTVNIIIPQPVIVPDTLEGLESNDGESE